MIQVFCGGVLVEAFYEGHGYATCSRCFASLKVVWPMEIKSVKEAA